MELVEEKRESFHRWDTIWFLLILCIQILESGFLGKKKNWWKRMISCLCKRNKNPLMRYYLVFFNFMYTDFGKWFLGEKEKLVEENGLCKRNKNLSIDEIIWSLVILCIQILESGFLRKRKIGGREWTLVCAREIRIFPSRYYLVSYNFI